MTSHGKKKFENFASYGAVLKQGEWLNNAQSKKNFDVS